MCKKSAPVEDRISYKALRKLDPSWTHCFSHYRSTLPTTDLQHCLAHWGPSTIMVQRYCMRSVETGQKTEAFSSYRPISLASSVGKGMERMVQYSLSWMLETTGFFLEVMAGFRRHRSAGDCISDRAGRSTKDSPSILCGLPRHSSCFRCSSLQPYYKAPPSQRCLWATSRKSQIIFGYTYCPRAHFQLYQ